jgi:YbbR domain-containing protein
VGHHTIKLRTSGLNSELRTALTPEKIKVNIQPRATTTVPVEVRLSSKSVNGGYEVGTPKSSMTNVQVSGARDEVRRVAKVVAEVNVPKDATSDLHRQVTLQALDKHGHILNVIISPNSVSVTVPISSNGMASSSNKETSSDSSNSSSAKDNQNNDDSSTESSNANSTSNNN